MIILQCRWCKKDIHRYKSSQKRSKNLFCSVICHKEFKINKTKNKILSIKYFGDLEVICQNGIRYSNVHYYDCKCKCGNISNIQGGSLLSGNTTKCLACASLHKGKKLRRYSGEFGLHLTQVNNGLKRKNGKRMLKNLLTNEILYKRYYEIQKGRCFRDGSSIKIAKTHKELSNPDTFSIDRINPNGDYTEDNIILVRKEYNTMKWDFTEEAFISYCCKIADYYRYKTYECS